MEIGISRIQSGGRHIYNVTVPYSDRGRLTMQVELTEKKLQKILSSFARPLWRLRFLFLRKLF